MKMDLKNIREEIYLFISEFADKNGYIIDRKADKANCRLTKNIESHKININMGIHHNQRHQRLEFNGFSTGIIQNNFSRLLRELSIRKIVIQELIINNHPSPNPNLEFGLCTVQSWFGFGKNGEPLLSFENRRIRITNQNEINLFTDYLTKYEELINRCVKETSIFSKIYKKISILPLEELVDKLYSEYSSSLPNALIFLVGFKSERIDEYISFLNDNNRLTNETRNFIEILNDHETIEYLQNYFNENE